MKRRTLRFVDLFCGIGGFRYAFEQAAESFDVASRCVFSCDIDDACARAYSANFGETPAGDIREINANDIPNHDVLLAGFPCQAFSIIGNGEGFRDTTRGTLFFDIARILDEKKPRAFVLENVKGLVSHDKGRTMRIILNTLTELGYSVDYKVLNALDFGLPQKRERVWIVGFLGPWSYEWPKGDFPMKPLSEVLEPDSQVPKKFWASDYIRQKRKAAHTAEVYPSIWHENKAGNVTSYPYSCALRANASYNYLLVNGERRLTPVEMLRLQGFPDNFKIVCTDSQTRNQAGNSLPVPVAREVIKPVIKRLIEFPKVVPIGGKSSVTSEKRTQVTNG
jgi:DNA (cytosine-5)-methyltransferase 1